MCIQVHTYLQNTEHHFSVYTFNGVVYNHWTGTVDWNGGIANSAKMRSKGHNVGG